MQQESNLTIFYKYLLDFLFNFYNLPTFRKKIILHINIFCYKLKNP